MKKGFTLIELLVVVAIIGILATVVLASLGQARTRASDAAGKAAISQARAEMELNFLDNDTYISSAAICDGIVTSFITSLGANGATSIECNATASTYAFFATLAGGSIFCADSTGFAGDGAATETGDMVCND